MPYTPRLQSETGFYHVFARGTGRQLIYEDADDRASFLRCLNAALDNFDIGLYAFCLMGNHYHLVVEDPHQNLSLFAHRLNRSYAKCFNETHGREGHLFQERFRSEPIEDESYFLTAIRYVHRNPVEAHLTATCNYPWSSYNTYLGTVNQVGCPVKTEKVLSLLGSTEAFAEFHAHSGKESFTDDVPLPAKLTEPKMLAIATSALNGANPSNLKQLPKPARNRAIRTLKSTTLSLSQIALITGISRSVIHRA